MALTLEDGRKPGSGRPPGINSLVVRSSPPPQTPIGDGIYLPNLSAAGKNPVVVEDIKQRSSFTPAWIGYPFAPNSGANLDGTNRAVLIAVTIPSRCTLTGMAFNVGTPGGNIDVGVYDNSGNRLGSSGSIACPAGGGRTVNFSSNIAITEPGTYYLAIAQDDNTASFGRYGTGSVFGVSYFTNSFPLPATLTFPGNISARYISLCAIVDGGAVQ